MSSSSVSRQRRIPAGIAIVATLLAIGLFTPTVAVADDSQATAERLFNEGRQHLRDDEHIRAAEKFLEAYDILGVPPLLYNIGEAYRRGGELAKAEEYYQLYLNEATDPPNEDQVVEMIIEIQQKRAAEQATISVISDPAGAQIYLDDEGEARCQAPCEVDLDPGSYSLRAELADHLDQTEEIELEPRDEIETTLTLNPETASGFVRVQTDVEGATLQAGGRDYRLPRSEPVELEEGSQSIAIVWEGDRIVHNIDVEKNEHLHLFIPVGATGSGSFSPIRASAIGLGGASLALAAAAVLTGMQASTTHENLEAQQQSFGSVDPDLINSGRSQRTITNGLWLGSIVTLGAGAGLWVWDMMGGSSSSDEPERIEPTPDDVSDDNDEAGVDLL